VGCRLYLIFAFRKVFYAFVRVISMVETLARAAPKTLFFNVDLPESFPVAPVATASAAFAIVLVGAGLVVYFKKRKH